MRTVIPSAFALVCVGPATKWGGTVSLSYRARDAGAARPLWPAEFGDRTCGDRARWPTLRADSGVMFLGQIDELGLDA